jgi:hypothetical protein
MKTNSLKAFLTLVGLILLNFSASANDIGTQLNKFVNNDSTSMHGVYIMLGVVVASLVTYLIVNHYNNKEEVASHRKGGHSAHLHHRRHHHKVVKKTS